MRSRVKSKRIKMPKYDTGKRTIDQMLKDPAQMQGSYAAVGNPGGYTWAYPEAKDGPVITPYGNYQDSGEYNRWHDLSAYDPNAPFEMFNQFVFGAPFALYDTADQAIKGTYGTPKAETPAQNLMGNIAVGLSPSRWAETARQGVYNQRWVSPWSEENAGIMQDPNLSNILDLLLLHGAGNSTRLANAKEIVGKKAGQIGRGVKQVSLNTVGDALQRYLIWRDLKNPRRLGFNSTEPAWEWADAKDITNGEKPSLKARVQDAVSSGLDYAKQKVRNVVAGTIGSAIMNKNVRNYDGTVGPEYFRDPYRAYRMTESPERYGIQEVGQNVTTRDMDAPGIPDVPSNRWREAAMDVYSGYDNEGYPIAADISAGDALLDDNYVYSFTNTGRVPLSLLRKSGSAHGNRTQAALGELWGGGQGGTAQSGIGRRGVLEISGGNTVDAGVGNSRSNFKNTAWEDVPIGYRVGYKTGEMPMDDLQWFENRPDGRYDYKGQVIPDKRIVLNKPSSTIVSEDYVKPWRDAWGSQGPINYNSATRYHFSDLPDENFELVKDNEPGSYSIRFKTKRGILNDEQKQQLFDKVESEIPRGSTLSTYGTITKGGVHGVQRFGDYPGWFKHKSRILKMKGSGEPVDVGEYRKSPQSTLDIPHGAAMDQLEREYNSKPNPLESRPVDIVRQAIDNSQIVDKDGNVNMHNVARLTNELQEIIKQKYGSFSDPKKIINSDYRGGRTNLYEHIRAVIKTASEIPLPKGYTRQQVVQAALLHDVGKVVNQAQGAHEQIGAEILRTALGKQGGKFARVQKISNDVIDAIENHGRNHHMIDSSDLTQALHFADVARGLSYDEAALRYPQLLTYQRDYPQFNFQQLPTRDQLKTVINPVLKRYGYDPIPLDLSEAQAAAELEKRIDQHNTFVRSTTNASTPEEGAEWASTQPSYKTYKTVGGGRRGFFTDRYGVNERNYDALYASTVAKIADTYGDENGRYLVSLKRPKGSYNAQTLAERLLAGDFDYYDSSKIAARKNPIGDFSMLEMPYRLQTGRSLVEDMKKDGFVKKKVIEGEKLAFLDDEVNIFNHETYRHQLNAVNSKLNKYGFKSINPVHPEILDEYGNMVSPGDVPGQALKTLEICLDKVDIFATHYANGLESTKQSYMDVRNAEKAYRNALTSLKKQDKKVQNLKKSFYLGEIKPENRLDAFTQIQEEQQVLERLRNESTDAFQDFHSKRAVYDYKLKTLQVDMMDVRDLTTYLTPKQRRAFELTRDPKYIDVKRIISKLKEHYFKKLSTSYKPKLRLVKPTSIEKLKYMRSKNVHPRFEYKTFNNVRTFTPNENIADAVNKLTSRNKEIGGMQIAVIGKRKQKVFDVKRPVTKREIKKGIRKDIKDRRHRDVGAAIKSIKLSRKTLE